MEQNRQISVWDYYVAGYHSIIPSLILVSHESFHAFCQLQNNKGFPDREFPIGEYTIVV